MVARAPEVLDSEYCERFPSLSSKHAEIAVTEGMRSGGGDLGRLQGGHVVPRPPRYLGPRLMLLAVSYLTIIYLDLCMAIELTVCDNFYDLFPTIE